MNIREVNLDQVDPNPFQVRAGYDIVRIIQVPFDLSSVSIETVIENE